MFKTTHNVFWWGYDRRIINFMAPGLDLTVMSSCTFLWTMLSAVVTETTSWPPIDPAESCVHITVGQVGFQQDSGGEDGDGAD